MLTKFLRGAAGNQGGLPIEYVGGYTIGYLGTTSNITVSLTSLTGGLASAPSAGDFVLVYFGTGSGSNRDLVIAGYTEIAELYANDSEDTNLAVAYKFMGATPDTSVTLTGGTGDISDGGAVYVSVWRNVDTIKPFDVTTTTATGLNSVLCNPPAITPITAGAVIVSGGAGAHTEGTETYSSSNLTAFLSAGVNDTNDVTVGGGYTEWTTGSFDPAQFTFSADNDGSFSWAAVTVALRPAQLPPNNFAIVGGTIAYTSGNSSLNVAYPSGIQANDLLVVLGYINGATSFGTISGWTNLGSSGSYDVTSWKVADGTESGTVSVTWAGSVGAVISMFRIRHTTTNPPTFGSGSGAYGTSPSVTLPTPSSYTDVCHIINYRNNNTINGFIPNPALISLNTRTTSYGYYGYEIEDAAGAVITATTTNNITAVAYSIYV
jgi:hypothetical protein